MTVERVIETVKKVVGEDNITAETSFKDVHADSLTIVEVVMAIEDEFDIAINDEDIDKLTDIQSLIELVERSK